jgi:hypothetical protein
MLPGFRFLFAAIVLSMSVLVFGLGAAALFRAAHETFASTPSWHTPPETTFAQQGQASKPVLSMLRVDTPIAEEAPDKAPVVTAPPVVAATAEPIATTALPLPPEQAATSPAPAEPEQMAALQPVDSTAPATANPDLPVAENPPDRAAPAQDEPAVPQAATPATADETRVAAATEQQQQPNEAVPPAAATATAEAVPAPPEPANAPSTAGTETFSTTIATLGGPPVNIGSAAKATDPKPDKGATKKHDQAKREHRHRRSVARAELAQAPQPVDPFGQPVAAPLRVRKPR